jgi:hypothetical protein
MSANKHILFSDAIAILVAMKEGKQSVKEISSHVGCKERKVVEWLEIFLAVGLVILKSTEDRNGVHVLGFSHEQQKLYERKIVSTKFGLQKLIIVEFIILILTQPRTASFFCKRTQNKS